MRKAPFPKSTVPDQAADLRRDPWAEYPLRRLFTRFYYQWKRWIPSQIRLGLRRLHAKQILKRCGDSWPIDERAANPPPGWSGWPDGKQFAFVLTHDVESGAGLAKCKDLAALDIRQGFRSSFNFIPEGSYRVPEELRRALESDGFEVGVHDLHHNGELFSTAAGFERYARKINRYLAEWNAVGFRAGFMMRNLDWIHQLNIRYDASTFDTDPFEPQPDGLGTIFPKWIDRSAANSSVVSKNAAEDTNSRSGYVELPYTLPQDSTLFVVLQNDGLQVWKDKVDWIAERGGMVLVNVHPDYLSFKQSDNRGVSFSASIYEEFLSWVKNRYSGRYWHALPSEVAEFTHSSEGRSAQDSSTLKLP